MVLPAGCIPCACLACADEARQHEVMRRFAAHAGAKLVRGAYMYLERDRANKKGYPSPIWPSIEETHANYDRCATFVFHADSVTGQLDVSYHTNWRAVRLHCKLGGVCLCIIQSNLST